MLEAMSHVSQWYTSVPLNWYIPPLSRKWVSPLVAGLIVTTGHISSQTLVCRVYVCSGHSKHLLRERANRTLDQPFALRFSPSLNGQFQTRDPTPFHSSGGGGPPGTVRLASTALLIAGGGGTLYAYRPDRVADAFPPYGWMDGC